MASEEKVHEIFETIASDYDKMNTIISVGQHARWRKEVLCELQKNLAKEGKMLENLETLDLCCGTGDWTFDLASQGATVTGLDFSEKMLSVARSRVAENETIQFQQGDAMALPFSDGMFDVVTIAYGLRNVPDYRKTLEEIKRVLRPQGMVVSFDTSHPTNPLYRPVFEFYFKHVMPFLARLFSRHYTEYVYLHDSAASFPDAKSLQKDFEEVGFEDVYYHYYSGGAVAAHFAKRINL
ncbi:MAG: demethylmenaquinone methyltransferase [Streptococcaceae bacterium]|jgi:demethylmenaquinone methyltransferase/2-methoxy-6-polyprenyl-1,4-benzoquinol methylase|nr:demethylmenaquinone methyltransferase [Streptococcaceae bacterium]